MLNCELLHASDANNYASISSAKLIFFRKDKLTMWSANRIFNLNIDKCKIITFTRKFKFILYNYHTDSHKFDQMLRI